MSHYLTPAKQQMSRKLIKSNTQNKAEDWICLICSNLNFSFRKKCNRCKTQTRHNNQNQLPIAYSRYYCPNQVNEIKENVKSPLSDATNMFTPKPKTSRDEPIKFLHRTVEMEDSLAKLAKLYMQKQFQTASGLEKRTAKPNQTSSPCFTEESSGSCQNSLTNQYWQLINVTDFDQMLQQNTVKSTKVLEQAQAKYRHSEYNSSEHERQREVQADIQRMFNQIIL